MPKRRTLVVGFGSLVLVVLFVNVATFLFKKSKPNPNSGEEGNAAGEGEREEGRGGRKRASYTDPLLPLVYDPEAIQKRALERSEGLGVRIDDILSLQDSSPSNAPGLVPKESRRLQGVWEGELAPIVSATMSTEAASVRFPTSNVIDGNVSTFCHSAEPDTDPWLELDLGRGYDVSAVRLVNRLDCCSDRVVPFEVWVGFGRANYHPSNVLCGIATNVDVEYVVACGSAVGRYVRVVLPGLRIFHVVEVEVYVHSYSVNNFEWEVPPPIPAEAYSVEVPRRDLHRYWRPPKDPHPVVTGRYLTFEPWHGGFNNRRMSLELAWVLAYVMNRTLVLPPSVPLANMGYQTASYEDFFDLYDLRRVLPVMSYEEYRKVRPKGTEIKNDLYPLTIDIRFNTPHDVAAYSFRTANDVPGRDPKSWELWVAPPGGDLEHVHNMSDYDFPQSRKTETKRFTLPTVQRVVRLRWVILAQKDIHNSVDCKGESCLPVCQIADIHIYGPDGAKYVMKGSNTTATASSMPLTSQSPDMLFDDNPETKFFAAGGPCGYGPQASTLCKAFSDERNGENGSVSVRHVDFFNEVLAYPTLPAPGSPKAADLAKFAKGRNAMPFLTARKDLQQAPVLHFPQVLFSNWYTMLWTEDPALYRRIARMVRDNVHYSTAILERATRIARYLGSYSSLHVRRTDFKGQYDSELFEASDIIRRVKNHFHPQETIYISSDESNDTYFQPFHHAFHRVVRLQDVLWLFGNTSTPFPSVWFPCVEQLVCAMGRMFVGTRLSTFSSYIVRVRGYMNKSNVQPYFTDTTYPGSSPLFKFGQPYSWADLPAHSIWQWEYPEAWEVD